jgi:hypothetical protein
VLNHQTRTKASCRAYKATIVDGGERCLTEHNSRANLQSNCTNPFRILNGEPTTIVPYQHIPAEIASPLTKAITIARQNSVNDFPSPLKCGPIGIPQYFNSTMRVFVARIYKDICNDTPIYVESVLERLQGLRIFYNLDQCEEAPMTSRCVVDGDGMYISLEGNLLRISYFEAAPYWFWEHHYTTHEMETPPNAALIKSYLVRFLQDLPPYSASPTPPEDEGNASSTTIQIIEADGPIDKLLRELPLKAIILDIDAEAPTDQLDSSILATVENLFQVLPIPILHPKSAHTAAYSAAVGTAQYGRRTLQGYHNYEELQEVERQECDLKNFPCMHHPAASSDMQVHMERFNLHEVEMEKMMIEMEEKKKVMERIYAHPRPLFPEWLRKGLGWLVVYIAVYFGLVFMLLLAEALLAQIARIP